VFSGQVPTFAVSPTDGTSSSPRRPPGRRGCICDRSRRVTVKAAARHRGRVLSVLVAGQPVRGVLASGKLRKVAIAGGSPSTSATRQMAAAALGRWRCHRLRASAGRRAGARVRHGWRSGGGHDARCGAARHGAPLAAVLPERHHFLFLAATSAQPPLEIRVGAIDSRDTTALVAADSMGVFASGHLFFWRDGKEMARPFDPDTRSSKATRSSSAIRSASTSALRRSRRQPTASSRTRAAARGRVAAHLDGP
jgi:hypothetical protein